MPRLDHLTVLPTVSTYLLSLTNLALPDHHEIEVLIKSKSTWMDLTGMYLQANILKQANCKFWPYNYSDIASCDNDLCKEIIETNPFIVLLQQGGTEKITYPNSI